MLRYFLLLVVVLVSSIGISANPKQEELPLFKKDCVYKCEYDTEKLDLFCKLNCDEAKTTKLDVTYNKNFKQPESKSAFICHGKKCEWK